MSTVTLFPRRAWSVRLGHAAAVLALGALVVGVPIALSFGGSPLPDHWPHLTAAWRDLRAGYVPAVVLENVALVAGWFVWAFLSFEILAEGRCVLRTHTSRRAAALGPLQPLVAKLVATAILSLPLATIRPMVRPAAASAIVLTAQRGTASPGSSTSPAGARTEHVALATYTVRRGDTLWGIAARYLGDPLRWKEIAALNADRHEGAGEFSDPHWIYPGWTLVLPAGAKGLPEEAAPPNRATTAPAPSTPSNTAGAATPDSQPHRLVPTRPKPTVAPATSEHSPSRAGSAQPTTSPGRPTPGSPTGGGDKTAGEPRPHTEAPQRPSRAPIAPVGLGILAVGLLGLLVRLRRTQERHRRAGRQIPLPTGATADIERALIADVDRGSAALVDRAGRLLGHVLRDAPEVPTVLGAVITDDTLDYQLDTPAVAPAPFTNSAPNSWRLDRSDPDTADALALVEDAPSMLPCLVTVGTDDEDVVMLNLESVGSVALVGDDAVACELATAIGLELSSASWAEFVELFDVGIGTGRAVPERCTTVESLEESLSMITQRAKELGGDLERGGWSSLLDARLHDTSGWWTPATLVAAHPSPASALTSLRPVIAERGPSPLVVVVGELPGAALRLEVSVEGSVAIPALGRTVAAHRVSRSHLAGIASLLGLAAQRTDVPSKISPYADLDQPEGEDVVTEHARRRATPSTGASVPRLFDPAAEISPSPKASEPAADEADERHVEIAVLGPIELLGRARDPERSKSIELVTWLVLHRGRGETDAVATALWPTRRDPVRSVWNIIWDARRMLGNGSDDKPLLERAGDLVLSDEVTTDWARFCLLARSVDPAKWHEALALVRGRPFGDVDWGWATLDGHASSMTAEITDVACRTAERALEDGDARNAEWSAEAGLRACPYDERLFRILMRAHDLDGNLAAVRETMERLRKVVEDDVEPVESLHPETNELYAKLTRRAPDRVVPPRPSASGDGVIRPMRRPQDA